MATSRKHSRGFTLIEMLVAMVIVTLISLVVMGSVGPWLAFKQKLDNERKMQDVKNGLTSLYAAKSMAIELQGDGVLDAFATATAGSVNCEEQSAAFIANAERFSDSTAHSTRDGYGSPWCIFISRANSELKDGVTLWFRNIAIVSGGPDGVLDADTSFTDGGTLTLGGDDAGVTISGREIQAEKLKETLRRMNRVAQMYETYFTTRYLANSARDITLYYFSTAGDPGGAVPSTNGTWTNAATALNGIGVGPTDAYTPWETNNAVQVGNYNESINGSVVRSPATSGTGVLPYTALLRARVPSPASSPSYAVQAVIGNY